MGRILKEVTLGMEPTLTSDEALDFAEKMEREVAQIRAAGQEVERSWNAQFLALVPTYPSGPMVSASPPNTPH